MSGWVGFTLTRRRLQVGAFLGNQVTSSTSSEFVSCVAAGAGVAGSRSVLKVDQHGNRKYGRDGAAVEVIIFLGDELAQFLPLVKQPDLNPLTANPS